MGTWFRDYVYIPIGGNKGGLAKQLRNIAIVWLLTGFSKSCLLQSGISTR